LDDNDSDNGSNNNNNNNNNSSIILSDEESVEEQTTDYSPLIFDMKECEQEPTPLLPKLSLPHLHLRLPNL